MDSFCVFMIFACLFPKSSADILSDSETGRTASTVVKEGLSAEIFCMVEGTGDYFWSKGESFQTSILVASFTGGNDNKDNEPYVVTVNGTLFIRKVTLTDEGKYYCRFTSVENECHGKINVIVQASLSNFFLAIDRCDRESSCLFYLNPSQSISLTCTAHNAPPLMTLKWFNGSKEMTEGIQQNEILPQNGNSREITSTVVAVYGHPASLTCQAVDPKRSNDDVRFAHAQVEMTVPAHESLPSWIIVSVTSIGCFIVFGIFLLITAMASRKQKKKYKMLKKQRYQSLQKEAKTKEEAINLQHKELTEVKVSAGFKESELSELKGKLRQTEEELKKSRKENIDSLKRIASNEAKITLTEEIAKTKDQEIKNKDEELTKLKLSVPYRLQVISSLKEDVHSKEKALADLESKLKQKEAEVKGRYNQIMELQKSNSIAFEKEKLRITAAKDTLRRKDEEITKERNETFKLKEFAQKREKEITTLRDTLRRKDEEIAKERNETFKLKDTLRRKDEEIAKERNETFKLKDTLRRKDEEIAKERNETFKLKDTLRRKDEEITKERNETFKLKELAQRKEQEIIALKDTLRRKDEEITKERNETFKLKRTMKNATGKAPVGESWI